MSRKSNRAVIEQRRAKVATLLTAGVSYRRMAESLGVSLGTIARDVGMLIKQWAKEQSPENRERWRVLELEKLNELEFAINPQAKSGNQGAVDRVLRVMERRAKLLGLDMPTRADITSGGEPLPIPVIYLPAIEDTTSE